MKRNVEVNDANGKILNVYSITLTGPININDQDFFNEAKRAVIEDNLVSQEEVADLKFNFAD